ncbi:hypothetical protein C8J56DRAFT_769912 [Mycena floridula]|nr:hypothetical protein C8J56DRAFT_769912 [Mycena floridula]
MSTVMQLGENWTGLADIERLIIFGDSYSSVGFDPKFYTPTRKNPLGPEFPGLEQALFNEPYSPNWVGYLLKSLNKHNNILVYDYAVGGNTVAGVAHQVEFSFLEKSQSICQYSARNSLWFTFVGINDCAFGSQHENSIAKLFGLQEQLYEAGARNFCFFDIPPVAKSPAVPASRESSAAASYLNWNSCLRSAIQSFCDSHPDISAFLFSTHDVFSSILEEPTAYGFKADDVKRRHGGIWYDHLHPTSRVHEILANQIEDFLRSIEPIVRSDSPVVTETVDV